MEYNKKKDNKKYFALKVIFHNFFQGRENWKFQQGKSYENIFMEPLGMMN